MATSITSQLQAIKTFVQAGSEPQLKRPFTRPSIIFEPKEASDIDIDTIFSIALQGIEVLISIDERFRNYKNDLFSHKSKELDRELMGIDENNRINATISSYLRLISVHFQLPSAIKTLEYLIRRYRIHEYNVEELIMCSLPYHDTHTFVRIVQLIDTGNSKWRFLDAVKVSGAPPPRKVIVQQCLRDKGILEVLCNYASPSKKFLPSRPVIILCTAVIIEALGSVSSVDNEVVMKILPFVSSGLQPGARGGSDHKAGALMIVGLLASKASLSAKLVKTLIRSLADIAQEDSKESSDLQWLRLSVMTLIHLVQLQPVDVFPKKALEILINIRDLTGIFLELSKDFNIDRFLSILLDSLVDYSSDNESCQHALITILEIVPAEDFIHHLITKVLSYCFKSSQKLGNSIPSVSGNWAKEVLFVLNKKYPSELHGAVRKFVDEKKVQPKKGESKYDILCKMLDGSSDTPLALPDSKLLFALHHPEAEVRLTVLSSLSISSMVASKATDPQGFLSIQDAIVRQIYDEDLNVVQAALSVRGLSDIINYSDFLEALRSVLKRCVGILTSNSSENTYLVCDVAICCLNNANAIFLDHMDHANTLIGMIFSLLLILPKTQRLNLKALELARGTNCPLFDNLPSVSNTDLALHPGSISSVNMDTITQLAERFMMHAEKYIPCVMRSCNDFTLSKILFFLVLMQSFMKNQSAQFLELLEVYFPVLKTELEAHDSSSGISVEEFNKEMLNWDCRKFIDQLSCSNLNALSANIVICIFWKLLEAFTTAMPTDGLSGGHEKWASRLQDLFVIFSSSHFNQAFKEHRHYLVTKSKISPVHFLCSFFTVQDYPVEVQVESLHCFKYLCFHSNAKLSIQLLSGFPSVLVPLGSQNQGIRAAAMSCIEGLHALWGQVDSCSKKNGNHAVWSHFLDKLLDLIVQQKRLILSDSEFLPSLVTCLLSSSCHSLLVPKDVEQRFDQSTREKILAFILGSALKLSDYAKLMILSLLKEVGSAIIRVKDLESFFSQLLTRRMAGQHLSKIEVDILCLLLENCTLPSSFDGLLFENYPLKAMQLDGMDVEDPVVVRPCIVVLQRLNNQIFSQLNFEMQELLFRELVVLFRNANSDIQNRAREALLRINITCSIVLRMLDYVFESGVCILPSAQGKKKKKKKLAGRENPNLASGRTFKCERTLSFLSSLLDILLLKKDLDDRHLLLDPLFKLLGKTFSDDWIPQSLQNEIQNTSDISQTPIQTMSYIQQTLLIILENIFASLIYCLPLKDDIVNEINLKVLIECVKSATDGVTRNHVFSVFSSVAKMVPEKVVEHIQDIFAVIGESTVTQMDSHSKRVFEDFISTVVPCWLSTSDNIDTLLQVFMNVLPEVAGQRRLSIVVYLLRTLGESNGLAALLSLLFHSLVSRKVNNMLDTDSSVDSMKAEWEYNFALQICEQYSCVIWLPSLSMLLKRHGSSSFCPELCIELLFAIQFTSHKFQDPEFAFKVDSGEDVENIQSTLEDLMEQTVFLLQHVHETRKEIKIPLIMKSLKESMHAVLRTITMIIIPSAFFRAITKLLSNANGSVKKKALGLLCETVREHDPVRSTRKSKRDLNRHWHQMDDNAVESFRKMCAEIVRIVDNFADTSNSLKVAAVSALEVLASRFPSEYSIFSECVKSVTKNISLKDLAVSSSCLRTTGALVNVLGPRALAELPSIMENVIKTFNEVTLSSEVKDGNPAVGPLILNEAVILSVLVVLEAVVDKLGSFLNPYLGDVINIMILHPVCTSGSDLKLKLKADTIQKLITEKIPVRLSLPPLLKIYDKAVQSGDSSLIVYFGMLANLITVMDRSFIDNYCAKLFDLCLQALDIRSRQPVSVNNIYIVEKSVINTLIFLTMKLTETKFKPLFIRSIEWAESDSEVPNLGSSNINRAISFYGLINKLAESHRSLFVPYFKYLLDSCVRHLSVDGDAKSTRKKKKAKILEDNFRIEDYNISLGKWQLRSLVLSSLHKCFLYDTRNLKFLDSSNFQVLLKPIVSQLVVEPPNSLEEHTSITAVNEVDDLLVSCIGQMAVTAGSDLLWKSLNHEVLMQTRSDKIRARILGLRIVKYLVEHLRKEYLVFLAETIPFLGELLEDVELSVKSLAQDILKQMESMSGESLRQYL